MSETLSTNPISDEVSGESTSADVSVGSDEQHAAQGATEANAPWYSKDHLDLASSYGLEEADLKGLENEKDLERLLSVQDRIYSRTGKAAIEREREQIRHRQEAEPTRQQYQPQQREQRQPNQQPATAEQKRLAEKLREAGYDGDLIELAKQVEEERDRARQEREELEGRLGGELAEMKRGIAEHNARVEAARWQAVETQFDTSLDALKLEALVGKSFDTATNQQKAIRQALIDEYQLWSFGQIATRGQAAPPTPKVLERFARALHPEFFEKRARQEVAKSVRKVSALRGGSGGRTTPPTGKNVPLIENPVLKQAWAQIQKRQQADGVA